MEGSGPPLWETTPQPHPYVSPETHTTAFSSLREACASCLSALLEDGQGPAHCWLPGPAETGTQRAPVNEAVTREGV